MFVAEGQCQAGWREYEDRCYLFSTDVKTWLEANRYCLEQNSNLLSVQSFHETVKTTRQRPETDKQNFLLFNFKPLFFFPQLWVSTQIGAEVFWIGLNDQVTEGVWEWSDGTTYIEYYSYVKLILKQRFQKKYIYIYFIHICMDAGR